MTRKGQKTGIKLPSSYDVGDGAVNIWLAILLKAKRDKAQMWLDFEKTELGGRNVDPLSKAEWVSGYIKRLDKKR